MRATLSSAVLFLLSLGILASASLAHAELSQDEMHATIMAALLSDPRTATVPPTQLQALVNVLAENAVAQGLNAQDIKWQTAAVAQTFGENGAQRETDCTGLFPSLCVFSEAFGFSGSDASTPLLLFGTSGLLLFLLYELIHHHRKKLKAEKTAAVAAAQASVTPPVEPPTPPTVAQ